MHIQKLEIKNYRSIDKTTIPLNKINMLCGPNSSGKSNILRAMSFAFDDFPKDIEEKKNIVKENISYSKTTTSGTIKITITFKNAPVKLYRLGAETNDNFLIYTFKITKSGTLTRSLSNKDRLSDEEFKILKDTFNIIYIPTIRDLENDGLSPFKKLFKKVMQNNRMPEMKKHLKDIKETLTKKAKIVLNEQKSIAKNILNATSIDLQTEDIYLDSIYENISLNIKKNTNSTPLKNIGTGHQSVVIINLYKQLGTTLENEKTLYLFEEPDAHLHPSVIREIGKVLIDLSTNSQVLISTHSPILISYIGLKDVIYLENNKQGTIAHKTDLGSMSQPDITQKLFKYGLRITETLFTKLVVLVEGSSDTIVISRLIENMTKKTADQLDIMIIPANGKDNIVELSEIITKLNVKWIAIFDFDACQTTSSIPITADNIDNTNIAVLENIVTSLNINYKRGKNVRTQLNLLIKEIENGRPTLEYYNNSTLKNLIEKSCTMTELDKTKLVTALKKGRVLEYRKILAKHNIWLLKNDLEDILIGNNDKNLPIIDPILRISGFSLQPVSSQGYKDNIKSILHNKLANKLDVYVSIIDALYNSNSFGRTDLNYALQAIIKYSNVNNKF